LSGTLCILKGVLTTVLVNLVQLVKTMHNIYKVREEKKAFL